jgi:transposase
MHARAAERVKQLEQRVQELEAENRKLRQQAFGRKTEKPSRGQDWLSELEREEKDQDKRGRGQRRGQPGPQRRDYQHLPARTELIELPPAQYCCPDCGQPYGEREETEDSEQVEIEVTAHRRVIKRKRYQPRCRCKGPWQIVTAPAPPKLIAKSRLGISVWVEILLDKFVSQRPTERLLEQWRLLGLDLAAGTVTGGLQRLEPLFTPLYEAVIARQQQAGYWQGDETRWRVFVEQEGKVGHQWWLWVFLSPDTVVFVLDPSRSRRVPQEHLPQEGEQTGVMMVGPLGLLQSDDPGQERPDCAGVLLGPCAPGLYSGRQSLAGVERVGLGLAATHSRRLSSEPSAPGGAGAKSQRQRRPGAGAGVASAHDRHAATSRGRGCRPGGARAL